MRTWRLYRSCSQHRKHFSIWNGSLYSRRRDIKKCKISSPGSPFFKVSLTRQKKTSRLICIILDTFIIVRSSSKPRPTVLLYTTQTRLLANLKILPEKGYYTRITYLPSTYFLRNVPLSPIPDSWKYWISTLYTSKFSAELA